MLIVPRLSISSNRRSTSQRNSGSARYVRLLRVVGGSMSLPPRSNIMVRMLEHPSILQCLGQGAWPGPELALIPVQSTCRPQTRNSCQLCARQTVTVGQTDSPCVELTVVSGRPTNWLEEGRQEVGRVTASRPGDRVRAWPGTPRNRRSPEDPGGRERRWCTFGL